MVNDSGHDASARQGCDSTVLLRRLSQQVLDGVGAEAERYYGNGCGEKIELCQLVQGACLQARQGYAKCDQEAHALGKCARRSMGFGACKFDDSCNCVRGIHVSLAMHGDGDGNFASHAGISSLPPETLAFGLRCLLIFFNRPGSMMLIALEIVADLGAFLDQVPGKAPTEAEAVQRSSAFEARIVKRDGEV